MRFISFLVGVVLLTSSAFCQTVSLEQDLLDFFSGSCVYALTNFDRDRAAAKFHHWEPVTQDALKMLASEFKDAKMEGWVAKTQIGNKFILILSEAEQGNGCAILNGDFSPKKIIDMLGTIPNVTSVDEPKAFAQRQKMWVTEINNQQIFISLVYSSNNDELGGSLGAAAIWKK
jgi:hypothetical protein